jgi:hypothetical protein
MGIAFFVLTTVLPFLYAVAGSTSSAKRPIHFLFLS